MDDYCSQLKNPPFLICDVIITATYQWQWYKIWNVQPCPHSICNPNFNFYGSCKPSNNIILTRIIHKRWPEVQSELGSAIESVPLSGIFYPNILVRTKILENPLQIPWEWKKSGVKCWNAFWFSNYSGTICKYSKLQHVWKTIRTTQQF